MAGILTLMLICVEFYLCEAAIGVNVTVSTSVGDFIGFKKNLTVDGNNVQVSTFLGIPYAEPPIGDLRFRKPIPKAPLTLPMVSHEHGHICIQAFGHRGPSSEDCLFLNIFVPEKAVGLAVMIFIHGGGYVVGSSNPYVGDLLATRGNVIVVTINYRLSVLGFLNAEINGDSNFGLWDQHLAIKWVHDNIQAFGGDNGRITIFGQSAGAGSVIYQGLYPGNKGLFQRIVAESGTAHAQWGIDRQPKAEARKFAALVGCNFKSTLKLMACLRNISTSLINKTMRDLSKESPRPFAPSPDREFSPITPSITLNRDRANTRANDLRSMFAPFDLMMGVNSGEGAGFLSPVSGVEGDSQKFLPNRSYFEDTIVPLCARGEFGKNVSGAIIETLINGYTPWNDPENPYLLREKFLDMHGDVQFLVRTVQTIELYSNVSNKDPYLYYFTAVPSSSLTPKWVNRPNHGEEQLYVWGEVNVLQGWRKTEFTDWEIQLTKRMMTMWSNFAKSGNPNLPRQTDIDWLPYNATHHNYLYIGKFANQTEIKKRLFEGRVHLWNEVLPKIAAEKTQWKCVDETSASEGDETSGSEGHMTFRTVSILAVVLYLLTT